MEAGSYSTKTAMKDEYAFGDWELNQRKCPISSAGLRESDFAGELAELYDEMVPVVLDEDHEGVLPEEQASKVWDKVIKHIESKLDKDYKVPGRYETMLGLAEAVQAKEFDN